MAISLVDTSMESVAVQRLNELLILVSGQGPAPGLLEARASSFEAVYNAHHRDVSRHVILVTRGRDDVEEIVAETFARAFAAWRSGHGPAGRPLPWLLVIARRIATDRWRRQRLIAWLPLPDSRRTHPGAWEGRHRPMSEPGGPDTDANAAEFWLWLDALSLALPARQRDVIFLRYQHDLTRRGHRRGPRVVGLGGADARLTRPQRPPQAPRAVVMSQADHDLIRSGVERRLAAVESLIPSMPAWRSVGDADLRPATVRVVAGPAVRQGLAWRSSPGAPRRGWRRCSSCCSPTGCSAEEVDRPSFRARRRPASAEPTGEAGGFDPDRTAADHPGAARVRLDRGR